MGTSTSRRTTRAVRRRLSPEERRGELLDAATALILEHEDLDAATLERVAEAAGCSRNLVYTYFGNHDGLLDALADRERAEVLSRLGALDPAAPVRDWCRQVAEALLDRVAVQGPLMVMLFDRGRRGVGSDERQLLVAVVAGRLRDAGLPARRADVVAPILGSALVGAMGAAISAGATVDELLPEIDRLLDGLVGPG